MNWVILIGLALFFVATAIRNGAGGWHFGDNGAFNLSVSVDDDLLRVTGHGDVDLAPDGSGITSLDDGAELEVRMTGDGAQRRVRFAGENGGIVRQFWVGGDEQPWGPEADRFVTEVMPILLRETAIDVEDRVAWLLANRGSDGLLDEIELIHSDFAQRAYTVQYASTTTIAPADFARLMTLAETNMDSDFDLRTTLISVHETQTLTDESFAALLGAGRSLGSDFDARVLLQVVGPGMPDTPEVADAYLGLAATIGSDFDLRTALLTLVTSDDLGDELVAGAIELAANEISSDFDLRVLLGGAVGRVGSSDTLARAYTTAAASIGSDFDLRTALLTLANGAALTPAGWKMLLESAQGIDSDFDCAMVLMAVASDLPQDPDVIAAYRATLATVGSDFERQRATAALENATR